MIDLDSAIALIYGIIMLYMIFNAFKTYVPDPNAITERQYMVDHFNMSPSGLKEVADIKINLNQYGT